MTRSSLSVRARRVARRFSRAESGQIAIIFAVALIPLLFASGAAIDYMRWSAAKTQLDAALDSAILGVVSQRINTIDLTQLQRMETQFRAEANKLPDVTVTSFVPQTTIGVTALTLKASYKANVKTTLASLMNINNLVASGTASAQREIAKYVDFYLLLDNSPSMGLAATDDDINKMKTATPDKCAFACHKHTFDKKGNITGDDPNDYYTLAKKNNIKLRIHVLRDAVANLIDTAKSVATLVNQYQMEIWTFSENPTRISGLTPNLDQTKTNAAAIDLAYSLYGEPDNQTGYERALKKLTTTVPASGTGITALSPIRFLFFVTDGVQDTPIDSGGVSNPTQGYQINSNRFISPINPANCQALKDKDVRIGIIYTTYLPLNDNEFYKDYVRPLEAKIPAALKSCASDGLFFQVSTGGDINAAMQQLFATALASVRLTD